MRTLLLLLISVILLSSLVFAKDSYAASTATVTATVTVENISVAVSDGSISYGVLAVDSSTGTNGTDTQTASNDGNVVEDFNIRGQNSAGWTLNSVNTGTDNYIHRFCTTSCASPPTSYTALTTNYQTLASAVSVSGNQTFDLYITTPQTSTVFTQQSVDITVQAVAN
jgi:hypothetical protein